MISLFVIVISEYKSLMLSIYTSLMISIMILKGMISCMISYMILRVQTILVPLKNTRIYPKSMISAHISKTEPFLAPLKCQFLNDIMTQ
jgi:hypothetical protein